MQGNRACPSWRGGATLRLQLLGSNGLFHPLFITCLRKRRSVAPPRQDSVILTGRCSFKGVCTFLELRDDGYVLGAGVFAFAAGYAGAGKVAFSYGLAVVFLGFG